MITGFLEIRFERMRESLKEILKSDKDGKLWELCKTSYMVGAQNTLDLLCSMPLDEAINELSEYTKSKLQ